MFPFENLDSSIKVESVIQKLLNRFLHVHNCFNVHILQVQQQIQQDHQTVEIQTVQHHVSQNHQPQTITVVSGNQNLLSTINSPQPQESSPHRPQYGCRECGSAFNSKEAHALHMRLHTGDKSLMTDLCALTAAIPGLSFQGGKLMKLNRYLPEFNAICFYSCTHITSPCSNCFIHRTSDWSNSNKP